MKNLLPLGSVITLEEATKDIMIIGTQVKVEDDDKVYDYLGVPYPEGFIDSEMLLMFMHEDIEKVSFIGYVDAKYQIYHTMGIEENEG